MEKYMDMKKVFEGNGFNFKSFPTVDEAREDIIAAIGKGDSTLGGSMTLADMAIYEGLKEKGNKVAWHWKEDTDLNVDKNFYLTSSNAISLDGKLVNMDGAGNRVASMITGYENVFVVVGKNKIVADYNEAIERIRTVAAPKNAQRLNVKTPCVKTGVCQDCSSPERICNAETIIHKNPAKTKITIYVIDEEIGY